MTLVLSTTQDELPFLLVHNVVKIGIQCVYHRMCVDKLL